MEAGNRAIRDHAQNGKALYLFTKLSSGKVRFVGEAIYLDHHGSPGPDRNGQTRQRIVFELGLESPATATVAADVRVPAPKATSRKAPLAILRKRALAVVLATATPHERRENVYDRSAAVRDYVLGRAKGVCEGCLAAAPFVRPDGNPYLEPHHTTRVADGGPDHPAAVIALCPNCHRRVHYGDDAVQFNQALVVRLASIEGSASKLGLRTTSRARQGPGLISRY